MSKITLTTSIVINHCYGGFSLSNKVALELAQRKGLSLKKDGQFLVVEGDFGNGRAIEDCFPRNDPDLLNLVRIYGDEANGECAKLEVKTVYVTVEIDDHDGLERIGNAYAENR